MKNIESSKLNKQGQVSIPTSIRKLLNLNPGDSVGFELQEDGNVVLKPVTVIDRRQAWFYAPEIQQEIRSSQEEIKRGKGQVFEDASEALEWLKK